MRAGERRGPSAREQVATILDAFTAGSASLATTVRVVHERLPDVSMGKHWKSVWAWN